MITQQLFGIYQKPIRKLSGNDFPIGLAVLKEESSSVSIPKTSTHVLIRFERVRERPAPDAPGERELKPGFEVRVIEFVEGEWAMIARDGEKLGYVPAEALAQRQ